MRDLLEAVAAGEVSPAEAQARLAGYATGEAGRFDAARAGRSGVPEAILATGKTPAEVAALAATAVETAGRAIVTRTDADDRAAVRERLADDAPDASVTVQDRAGVLVARSPSFEASDLDARVGVVTAGTSDAVPAGEAAVVAREMGATVERVDDVGVASLARTLDAVDRACGPGRRPDRRTPGLDGLRARRRGRGRPRRDAPVVYRAVGRQRRRRLHRRRAGRTDRTTAR
jgi:NCAIR mutase (PurE)-related protein